MLMGCPEGFKVPILNSSVSVGGGSFLLRAKLVVVGTGGEGCSHFPPPTLIVLAEIGSSKQ